MTHKRGVTHTTRDEMRWNGNKHEYNMYKKNKTFTFLRIMRFDLQQHKHLLCLIWVFFFFFLSARVYWTNRVCYLSLLIDFLRASYCTCNSWLKNELNTGRIFAYFCGCLCQSKRLLNNNFSRHCRKAYAMRRNAHLLGQHTLYICILMQRKESRKLKVKLFEYLLHKCGIFRMQMEFAGIEKVFPFSCCMRK